MLMTLSLIWQHAHILNNTLFFFFSNVNLNFQHFFDSSSFNPKFQVMYSLHLHFTLSLWVPPSVIWTYSLEYILSILLLSSLTSILTKCCGKYNFWNWDSDHLPMIRIVSGVPLLMKLITNFSIYSMKILIYNMVTFVCVCVRK